MTNASNLPGPPDPIRTANRIRDRGRLAAVAALGDAAIDAWCDDLITTACHHLHTPVALLAIVEPHRHRFLGAHGLPHPWHSHRELP